ncbi:MAG TPA: serine hydrolase domain-containing protein [Bacteroidia bacterium]|nr:serine hydrolase domain-containing protein [Bacteroidia bacterium]
MNEKTTKLIDDILSREISSNKTPSLQFIIFNKNSILHQYYSGYADVLNARPTTPQTTYHAYSVTKTFTALAVLQLVEQGKIDISKPIINYFSDFPYGPEITTQQLLAHTAGIPSPIPLKWIHLSDEHKTFNTNLYFKEIISKNSQTKSGPNEKFMYTNLGYILLGQLIEKISEMKYEEYIEMNILKKLGTSQAELGFVKDPLAIHAKGYHKKNTFSSFLLNFFINKKKYMDQTEGVWRAFKTNYVNGPAYGGLIGTANAFRIYIQELLKKDSVLLSDAWKQKMFTENFTINGKATGMCLSWFTSSLNGVRFYTHAGGGGGYYCELRIYPEKEIGSVIMFNRTGMTDERFLNKVDKYVITNSD